jgi:hypothetical protein
LSTPPDAVVYLDDVLLGQRPVIANDVQAGPHQLRLSAEGYRIHEETIALSHEGYVRGGEVPLNVEVTLEEHVTLLRVPVGIALGMAADARDFGDGLSLAVELFIEPWSWLEIGLGINTPPMGLLTLRFTILSGGFELGPLVRFAMIHEAPAGGDGAPALSGGIFSGYLFETGLGEAGARVEILLNRELKDMINDLWTVPVTLVAVWRI